MKLLIAEDEPDLAEALAVFLERNSFSVDTVHNGRDAYDYAAAGDYDALILDIMMPEMDGIEVLKRLREEGCSAPVMMLTAKTQKDDRITGFDAGADDYIPKPFAADELLSRLRAMLRRTGEYKPDTLTYGDLSLDCTGGLVSTANGKMQLSGVEFQIMETLLRNPRMLFSTENLMEHIWGWESTSDISVVWVHMCNLRKKLKSIGSRVTVRSVRGMGYGLEFQA